MRQNTAFIPDRASGINAQQSSAITINQSFKWYTRIWLILLYLSDFIHTQVPLQSDLRHLL